MLKIGVIGCGYWGPNLIRNFNALPDAEVAAIADLDEKRLGHVGLLYPGALKTTDHMRIIEDPSIDAVVVATPMTTHFRLGKQVLEAGKHLFLEKPMATTADDCRALNTLAAKQGRHVMVGHTFIYTPAVRKIKSLMDTGELGDVYYVNIQRVNLGLFQKDANVVWDLAPHDVSMLNFLFDGDPVRVSATGRCYVQQDLGVEDVAFLTLEYPNGRLAHIHVSWLDPNKIRNCTVVGSRKMLVYDDVSPAEKIRVYDKGVDVQPHYESFGEFQLLYRSGDVFIPRLDTVEPLRIEAQHFVDVINGKASLMSTGVHGLRVVQVLEQACRSIKEDGRPLDLVYND
ncbi:MAG TPA: Gfo/Idh/MocA family oxidoreductase [Candidatus Krumholzibacteria bacterium]|nr:Gfo/Idh/MocA family oxidoreductase [Candidatus Krumholzibacteria bacterium]